MDSARLVKLFFALSFANGFKEEEKEAGIAIAPEADDLLGRSWHDPRVGSP